MKNSLNRFLTLALFAGLTCAAFAQLAPPVLNTTGGGLAPGPNGTVPAGSGNYLPPTWKLDESLQNTADVTATSSVTLTSVTDLTAQVLPGQTYTFTATLYTTANASGGIQAAIGGTATATNIVYEGVLFGAGAIVAQTRAAALATAVGASTTTTAGLIVITGTITVNAGGTLAVQFAQNASFGTGSVLKRGSTFLVKQTAN